MGNVESHPNGESYKAHSFPGSAIVDSLTAPCGSLKDAVDEDSPGKPGNGITKFLNQAEALCVQSPTSEAGGNARGFDNFDDEYEDFRKDKENDEEEDEDDLIARKINANNRPPPSPANPTSALFARALISEVTDNPKTMTPAAMAEREKKFLKAQERAKLASKTGESSKPVGAPGGVGQPTVLGSIAHALTGTTDPLAAAQAQAEGIRASVLPPNSMSENRAQVDSNGETNNGDLTLGKHTITIGLSLSRRSTDGHPDSVTRQTAFDFNELQDREYKYVSSTDSSGWRAGGGERGGPLSPIVGSVAGLPDGAEDGAKPPGTPTGGNCKAAAPDTVHIPIIHIDAESPEAIDAIIAALARGEIFIPHMAITPEALSVDGVSPPDLVVRFGTERNDDLPPDDWPNWCLEFMHNQLYEYFQGMGARWMKRPFSITLAKKVRWKTVKHMNRYFAHAERVIDTWREKGPQYMDPQLAYVEGGATPEEVARPHGIYMLRNGVPTNYFAPNFDPPYTTKMTRSLLLNVMGKSWDKKRREWTSEPVPRLVTPAMLVTAMCGCGDNGGGGFIANEVTLKNKIDTSTIPSEMIIRSSDPEPPKRNVQSMPQLSPQPKQQQHVPKMQPQTPAGMEAADTDIMSEAADQMPSPIATGKVRDKEQQEQISPVNGAATHHSDQQLNLQFSSSSAEATRSQASSAVMSSKYDFPPTPGDIISPRSSNIAPSGRYKMEGTSPEMTDPGPTDNTSMETGAKSDFNQSATDTNSTIMHMNLSAGTFMKREAERRVARDEKKEDDPKALASDEDWLDEMGKPLPSPAVAGQTMRLLTEQEKMKEELDHERARQIELIAKAQEQTSKGQDHLIKSLNDDPVKFVLAKAVINSDKPTKKSSKDFTGINKNNSGVSLEYSVDSTYIGDASTIGSSLMGGKFATTDGSIATTSTKGNLRFTNARDDEEASGLSLQESTSTMEVIPTDEELFAAGWAKALDPKTGSHYYFTLDRTKIIWDNPLAVRGASMDSAETGSLPEGGVVI